MKHFYLLLVGLALFSSCVINEEPDMASKVNTGDALPLFSVLSLDGKTVISDELNGKVSLIVFFDTQCGDCRRELPKLEQIWKRLGASSSFALLPVSRGQTVDEVRAYWRLESFTMPVYLDTDRTAYSLFAESVIPRFYLADKDGIVRWTGTEELSETADELISKIEKMIE